MICTTANGLWLAGCLREAHRFRHATTRVSFEQQRVLDRLIRANAGTGFGRDHRFSTIRTARDYRERVPVRTYEEFRAYLDRVAHGSANVLTQEPVRLLEPTSGSASAVKLIPYTASLQDQFQRGINAWIADLFLDRPDLMRGQAYWSVSPALMTRRQTAGGIPIGFDDDAAYVGAWRRWLVRAVMAVPASLRNAADIDTFRYLTLLALIRSGTSLRLISVWNPTFLTLLVDRLQSVGDLLVHDVRLDRRRRDVLRTALKARTPGECHATLWPGLRVISCWADANAAAPAAALARLFPQAALQPKGLIATEGFISFPLAGHAGSVLAIRSHYFEFVPVGGDSPLLAHELQAGRRYEVVLSTAGGLYRYRLGDIVEVVGHSAECPLIAFVGRQAYVSDWFGEKLNESHVASALRDACDSTGVAACFAMVACDRELPRPGYVLYIDTKQSDELLERLGWTVETELRRNFHYNYARLLGQLGPVRVFRAEGAAATYLDTAVRGGQRAGDVKPLALDRRDGWSRRFRGRFVREARATIRTAEGGPS